MTRITRQVLIATSIIALAACAKKAPPELPPAPAQAEQPAYTPPPSGPAKGQDRTPVLRDDRGGHARDRPRASAGPVRAAVREPERSGFGRRGEIRELVVQEDPRVSRHEPGPEEAVDRRREGDDVARLVGRKGVWVGRRCPPGPALLPSSPFPPRPPRHREES